MSDEDRRACRDALIQIIFFLFLVLIVFPVQYAQCLSQQQKKALSAAPRL